MRATLGWLALAAATVALAVVGVAAALAAGGTTRPVEIVIHYSGFRPAVVEVDAGRPAEFVIRNDDPIDHEWIVGDAGVHERHRTGTEPVHASRPTEVSIPAGETRRTTVTFDRSGTYQFICHLPGHEAYGMVGTVVVRP